MGDPLALCSNTMLATSRQAPTPPPTHRESPMSKTLNVIESCLSRCLFWSLVIGASCSITNDCQTAAGNEPDPVVAPMLTSLKFETGGDRPIHLRGADARWQLQLLAADQTGRPYDATRVVSFSVSPPHIAKVSSEGWVTPLADGEGTITAVWNESLSTTVPLTISGFTELQPVSFNNQIVPIFTKYGCNGGGCHGKAAGQNGFKLSLLGFEPGEDHEYIVNEGRGRRVFPAAPEESLLLQKAINSVPHGGGQRLDADSDEYRRMVRWIAQGMPSNVAEEGRVEQIVIHPAERQLQRGSTQQLSVLAVYSDGRVEDVTRGATYESNFTDLAEVDQRGFVQLKQQAGDVAVMARYQGQVAVFRASVPLGIEVAQRPPPTNAVDAAVFGKLRILGIPASGLCDDATFLRRVTLDITGQLPSQKQTLAFLSDESANKRAQCIDRLLQSEGHADYFARKWVTILRNRRESEEKKFGAFAFHQWLRDQFYKNVPYDQWIRQLVTASGDPDINPAVIWYRQVPNNESRLEDLAQMLLGQRMQCARCHHHPFEKWSQTDYYQMAAFFSKLQQKPGSGPQEPQFVSRVGGAGAAHPKSGQGLQPAGLDAAPKPVQEYLDARLGLADWMVAPENPFFARTVANRYWKHFFGRGLVEPEDDMRVTNPPSNPELLDALASHLVEHNFDLKSLIRLICNSEAYQLTWDANEHNLHDQTSYSRYYPKRLTAEVLLDAVDEVLGTTTPFPGLPSGTRAVSLPDTSFSSYFLTVFGQPESTTACECERSQESTLAQSLHLLNSKEVQAKLGEGQGRPAKFAATSTEPQQVVTELYLRALSRRPTAEENVAALSFIQQHVDKAEASDDAKLAALKVAYEDLVWALINTKEFLFNH
ncbi:MAG: DUF1553 domain-containing protein [Pirellulaceae bacterium]|nr:DUF1553 domain-containing protein [Pirellulaceae bacterium]